MVMMRQALYICSIKGDWYDTKKYIKDDFGKPYLRDHLRDTHGSV